MPTGFSHRDVAGVAVDHNDRVYLATRVRSCIFVDERDGTFVKTWGEGMFSDRLHGLTIHPDGTLFVVDDAGHSVRHFTVDGMELAPIGPTGKPSDTGYDGTNVASVQRSAGPYNRPTNIAVAPNGDLYVSDGYGNARVHHFSPDGKLIRSWGEPGTGPGQFKISHGICVLPDGRVLVCDRENDRIQVFTPEGKFLAEWSDVQRPTHLVQGPDGLLYVAELWWRKGLTTPKGADITSDRYGRLSILDPTCGTGAFLIAALRVLEPLQRECLERLGRRSVELNDRLDNRRMFQARKHLVDIDFKSCWSAHAIYFWRKVTFTVQPS